MSNIIRSAIKCVYVKQYKFMPFKQACYRAKYIRINKACSRRAEYTFSVINGYTIKLKVKEFFNLIKTCLHKTIRKRLI